MSRLSGYLRAVVGPCPRVPAAVAWLCGLNLLLLVGLSVLTPIWRAPDEPNHADLVVGVRETRAYPAYDGRDVDPGIRASFAYVFFGRRSAHLLADEALPPDERPSREDLRAAGESVDLSAMGRPGVGNHMPQHPPGYYVTMAAVTEVADRILPGKGFGPYDREVAFLRLISLLAAAPLPLVAWWVATVAGASRSTAVAASIVPVGIPQLTHISSAVNSDAASILCFAVATGLLVRVARGERKAPVLVALGAVTGLALFVKGSAVVLPALCVLAVALGLWSARAAAPLLGREGLLVRFAERMGLVGLLALACGGWWWIANVVRFGEYAPSIEYSTRLAPYMTRPAGFEPSFSEWFEAWWFPLVRRYWGEFGWIDFALPRPALTAASYWVVLGLGLLLVGLLRRRSELGAATSLMLLAPSVSLAVFFGLDSYQFYRIAGFMAGVQGRYLFGGLVGLAVAVAAGWQQIAGRWTPLAFFAAAVVMQVLAVRAMLQFWWGAADASLSERVDAWLAWTPWPRPLTVAVVAALGLALVATAWALVRDARRGSDDGLVGELDEGDEVDRVGPEVGVVVGVGVDQVGPAVAE